MEMENNRITVTWLGHACFKFEYDGHSLVTDPFRDVPGLPDVKTRAGEVFASHGHDDHAYFKGVKLVKEPGGSPFKTTDIPSFHDEKRGALRGENTIRRFEAGGICIQHFGDIGHPLNEQQTEAASGADIAMIPVGGFFTVDGPGAAEIVEATDPKIVIPMHYRKGDVGYEVISGREPFLEALSGRKVIEAGGGTFTVSLLDENDPGKLELGLPGGKTVIVNEDDRYVLLLEIEK